MNRAVVSLVASLRVVDRGEGPEGEYLSLYEQLDCSGKTRYKEKLHMLQLHSDPYLLDKNSWLAERSLWPPWSSQMCLFI